jgi:ribulose 1,5-bisphosphate synthetase/thiazole synthase
MHCLVVLIRFGFLATTLAQQNNTLYDVIVIDSGPSGLSAASGLSPVFKKVVLFDPREYRNNEPDICTT